MKLLIWLIYPVAEAVIQGYLIEKRNWKPFYLQIFIIRGFAAIMYGSLILQPEYNLQEGLIWFFWCTCSFYAIFNPLLNKFRDKPFLYAGATSGWLDGFFIDKSFLHLLFYLLCLAGAIFSGIHGWNLF